MPSSFGMNEDAQRNKTFSYKNRQSTLVGENDTELKPKEVMLTKNLQNQIIERLNEKLNSQKLQYEQILNKNQIYL